MTFTIERNPADKCLECGFEVLATAPRAAACTRCGAIHGRTDDLQLRALTMRERAELAGDHDRMREFRRVHRDAHFAKAKTVAAGG